MGFILSKGFVHLINETLGMAALRAALVRKELGILQTKRLITLKMYKLFYCKGCSAPKFYRLPKIHKDGVTLRSILDSYCSPTGCLHFFAPLCKRKLHTLKIPFTLSEN